MIRRCPSRNRSTAALAGLFALGLVACGGGELSPDRPAPDPSSFPSGAGRTLDQIAAEVGGPSDELVVLPAGRVINRGVDRFGFAVVSVENVPITDASVAIYVSSGGRNALGPFPAAVETLDTKPAYSTELTSSDPDAVEVVYVASIKARSRGPLEMLAVVTSKTLDGTFAARVPLDGEVGEFAAVPTVGDRAPLIHTPTVDDVADLSEIDTRTPPSTMHDEDFADLVGERPVVLLFATPGLCQSRVCGPVVDVAEQVKAEFDGPGADDVGWIQMEIYKNNNPAPGNLREQVRAYHLPSEPWLFVIDRNGRIDTAIEGAFGITELEQAVAAVAR